jgi:hypothetical protein
MGETLGGRHAFQATGLNGHRVPGKLKCPCGCAGLAMVLAWVGLVDRGSGGGGTKVLETFG